MRNSALILFLYLAEQQLLLLSFVRKCSARYWTKFNVCSLYQADTDKK